MTRHAQTRSRQRGFNMLIMDIITNFGHDEPAIGGATKIILGKKESQQIIGEAKKLIQLLDKINKVTLIVKEGRIITMYKNH